MINSRAKGAAGEREFVNFLKDIGFTARRSAQYCGNSGEAADVLSKALDEFHLEVKRVEAFSLYKALEQATSDCKPGKIPLVVHRRNRKPWVVILDARLFFERAALINLAKIEELEDES